jgi:hypothetical protein
MRKLFAPTTGFWRYVLVAIFAFSIGGGGGAGGRSERDPRERAYR